MAEAPNIASLPENPNTTQKTLVLDFQDTLVQTSWEPLPAYDFTCTLDDRYTLYVLKRPGVDLFLTAMAEQFEVVLFTCTIKAYANAILDKLDPDSAIKHRLYRDSCKKIGGVTVKDLSILGRDLRNVIMLDNNPDHYMLQPENAVQISRFDGDIHDHELFDLTPILKAVAKSGNVTRSLRMIRSFQGLEIVRETPDEEPAMAAGRVKQVVGSKQEGGFLQGLWLKFLSLLTLTLAFQTAKKYCAPKRGGY